MLHARHYNTQKSETTLVSLAHRIRFSCYSHNGIDIPKRDILSLCFGVKKNLPDSICQNIAPKTHFQNCMQNYYKILEYANIWR